MGQEIPESERSVSKVAWAIFSVLVGMLAYDVRTVIDYGRLFVKLRHGSLVERGFIASDEWQNFLARAGRVELRRRLDEARGRDERGRSNVATAWAWIVDREKDLPADARVYLNVPTTLYYYYATFFWFPRRVDVGTEPALIKDAVTLAKSAVPLRPAERDTLARRGYTHAVEATPEGPTLIDLRSARAIPR